MTTPAVAQGAADEHQHRDVSGGWLRPAVFGAMDGLVTNLSLIAGVGGGGASGHLIVLTGLAGLAAGAFSMAAGEYVSVSSQNELVQAEVTQGAVRARAQPRDRAQRAGRHVRPARRGPGPGRPGGQADLRAPGCPAGARARGTRRGPRGPALAVRGRGRVAADLRGRRADPAAALPGRARLAGRVAGPGRRSPRWPAAGWWPGSPTGRCSAARSASSSWPPRRPR